MREKLPLDHPIYNIKINNDVIECVSSYIYLGLTIDCSLNWKDHIESVGKKIAPFVGACLRLRPFVTQAALMSIYFAWIDSRLTYCLPIWGSAPKSYLSILQTLQNKCLKIIQCKHYRSPTIHLYSENLLSLHQKIVYENIFTIYKMDSSKLKCNEQLTRNLSVTGYSTRSNSHIRLPYFTKKTSQKSLFYNGINLYNQIPNKIKLINNITTFKTELKKHIFETVEIKIT